MRLLQNKRTVTGLVRRKALVLPGAICRAQGIAKPWIIIGYHYPKIWAACMDDAPTPMPVVRPFTADQLDMEWYA